MASLNFNAATVQPSNSYEMLPSGEYLCIATASDMKSTKNGMGQYLEIDLQVIDGNFKGSHVWDRLNLINNNPKAAEIAQRQLSSLCHATGKITVMDSSELHNIPVVVTVRYKEGDGQYGPSNEVRGYKSVSQQAQPQAHSPAQPQHQAPPPSAQHATSGATPPWGRK